MKKLASSLAIIAATQVVGCATVLQGTDDTVNVRALGATDNSVHCTIKAGGDTWFANGVADTVTIDRSSKDLLIQCESETQTGMATAESSFQAGWLFADLLWDLCIITLSCPIDAATGAFYNYPDNVTVEMVNKDGTVNETFQVDKDEFEKGLQAKKASSNAYKQSQVNRS